MSANLRKCYLSIQLMFARVNFCQHWKYQFRQSALNMRFLEHFFKLFWTWIQFGCIQYGLHSLHQRLNCNVFLFLFYKILSVHQTYVCQSQSFASTIENINSTLSENKTLEILPINQIHYGPVCIRDWSSDSPQLQGRSLEEDQQWTARIVM